MINKLFRKLMHLPRFPAALPMVAALTLFIAVITMLAWASAEAQSPERGRRVLPESRQQVQLSYAPLVRQVAPAVVNIYTTRVVQVRRSSLFDDPFFRRFFGDNAPSGIPRERIQGSLGSGVIVRQDGVIITNYHVIGEADSIRVVLADRREFEAEVVLADERTDLAVLKITSGEGELLPALEFTNSDDVQVGDIVLAVGNPFGVGQTVTSGIVSATARTQVGISDFQSFIQTDAAVNPGNSGGALVGLDGRLIGINTAIFSRSGGNNGIGFAIPANMVRSVLKAALEDGIIMRPWLGASGQAVTSALADSLGLDRPGGVLVDEIYPNGPADRAGIEIGDVVLAVAGNEVIDAPGLRYRIATAESGERTDFRIYRRGQFFMLPVRLEIPPENPPRDETLLDGRHPFQGVRVANLSPRFADELGLNSMAEGVIVLEVSRRSPAGRRQFVRRGDIILTMNDFDVAEVNDLQALLGEPQANYIYRLRRGGRIIECGIIGNRSFYCR